MTLGAFPTVYWDDVELVSEDESVIVPFTNTTTVAFVAVAPGHTRVKARFRGVESNALEVDVEPPTPPLELAIDTVSGRHALSVGDAEPVFVVGTYPGAQVRNVTGDAYIESRSKRARIDNHTGVSGVAAGDAVVRTELDGIESSLDLAIWESFQGATCDERGGRYFRNDSNGSNTLRIETDCLEMRAGTSVRVLLDAHVILPETERAAAPCLDLVVTDGGGKVVRRLADEACGSRAVPPGSLDLFEAQARHAWDLRDDSGAPVAPGTYTLGFSLGAWGTSISLDVTVTP